MFKTKQNDVKLVKIEALITFKLYLRDCGNVFFYRAKKSQNNSNRCPPRRVHRVTVFSFFFLSYKVKFMA